MSKKPTYEELEQKVQELKKEFEKRQQLEKKLRKSEERYRAYIENANDGMVVVSKGKIKFSNNRLTDIMGFEVSELKDKDFTQFIPRDLLLQIYENLNKHLEGIENPKIYKTKVLHKNGSEIDVELNIATIETEDEPSALAIVRDITDRVQAKEERIKLQNQLEQTRIMETLSTLSAGIAHQFNNALYVVTANVDLLESNFPNNMRLLNYTKRIIDSALLMTHLTSQLLAYTRKGKYKAETLQFYNFIRETLHLIQHTIDSGITMTTDFPDDNVYVNFDQAQIQIVLAAILENASEAIDDKGCIRIGCTTEIISDQVDEESFQLTSGEYVVLKISDDGRGMDSETKERIFEPFFSTQFVGRGLGMAAVYGIIKNHHGLITVDSELGEGTTVTIYLPTVEIHVDKKNEPKSEMD